MYFISEIKEFKFCLQGSIVSKPYKTQENK